jgi:hypothetical protein
MTGTGSVSVATIVSSAPDTSIVTVGMDPLQSLPAGTNVIGAVQSSSASVEVVPTVNATASYSNGNVIGGIITLQNVLNTASNSGMVQSLTLKFKNTIQTGVYTVALFTASPTGTYADHANAAIANSDSALLAGIYQFSSPFSSLGSHTVYNIDGIGKTIVNSSGSNLYAVVTATNGTTVNCTSTSDMSLRIGTIL